MVFEAKVSFKLADLPKEILDQHYMQLLRLHQDSVPVSINGVSIYSDDESPSLAEINLAKAIGESRTDKKLYIIQDKIYGELPLWLRTIEDIDIDIDIELDQNLGFYLLVKSGPYGGNTGVCYRSKKWHAVKPFFEPILKMEKAQTCTRCGTLLVYANGEFVNDPSMTTCQCYCPERKREAEPVSI